jgi:hypothetical protein
MLYRKPTVVKLSRRDAKKQNNVKLYKSRTEKGLMGVMMGHQYRSERQHKRKT